MVPSLRTSLPRGAPPSAPLRAGVKDTLVVWAYCNENQDESFRHLEFESTTPRSQIEVAFILR
jgi:hypothetical protein